MRMARRFANDESGMTMALAIMMILLIGVMGAGLLTFVSRDLNTVVEENRGQRAFELADAGVNAAVRQLTADCTGNVTDCRTKYDAPDAAGDNIQWATTRGGLTLNDLDDIGGTTDNVEVKITSTSTTNYSFTVTSTGNFGNAKRKIEAKLKGVTGGAGGGGNITYAATYSPSTIQLNGQGISLKGMSLFSEKNIIINGLSSQADFVKEYEGSLVKNDDIFDTQGSQDALGDWYSIDFKNGAGNYNTVPRLDSKSKPFKQVGFAAQGMICGTASGVPKCSATADSIADGRYGYDLTTGSKGQLVAFVNKQPQADGSWPANTGNTITYPFPREPRPDPARLKQSAIGSNSYVKLSSGQQPDWNSLVPTGNNKNVVFIDAQGQNITYNRNDKNTQYKGIIVVWCGNLSMANSNFGGIILTMNGDGSTLPADPGGGTSTNCAGDTTKGKFTVTNSDLTTWIYATGGGSTETDPGVVINSDTSVNFLPSGQSDLIGILLSNPTPTSFATEGWRELYN